MVYAAVEIAFERDVDSQFRERTSGDEGGETWLRSFRMIKIAFDFSAEAFHLIKSVGGESLEMNVRELFAVLESAGKDKDQRFGAVGEDELECGSGLRARIPDGRGRRRRRYGGFCG